MRIVFLGTPDFAVASLKAILEAGYQVVGVVTAPDKPAGRGMQLQPSAVKKFALEKGLKILQPVKLRDESFLEELRNLKADLQVVIAFRMLPEVVWNMPPLGTINLHASLLPDYRGAAPINWAIINGEKKSGVSTFFLKHEIDTGDLLLTSEVTVSEDTTAGELHDVLMLEGARVIVDSLKLIEAGNIQGKPQGNESTKTAPKIFKEHCLIHWNNAGESIYNLIRGMSPYPAAYTQWQGKNMKVFNSHFMATDAIPAPGTFDSDGKSFLRVSCLNGWVYLDEVQLESKKRMDVQEFLRGQKWVV